MRRAKAINTIEGGGDSHRTAGIAAKRKVAQSRAAGGGRARRRSSRQAAWRTRIQRRAVMRVGAAHAVEEFIANGLAGDGRSRVEDFLHRRAMMRGGRLSCEPVRTAAACAFARDVVHVLDHRVQPGERSARRTFDRRFEIVGNKATAIGLRRHVWCVPLLPRGQVPVEDFRAVPGDHAVMCQELCECPLHMADAMRHAGEIRMAGHRHDLRALGRLLIKCT